MCLSQIWVELNLIGFVAIASKTLHLLEELTYCFSLKDIWFSGIKFGEGPVFMVNVFTIFNKMNITVAWPTPIISKEMAQSFTDSLIVILKKSIKGRLLLKDILIK